MKRVFARATLGAALLCLFPAALLAADHEHMHHDGMNMAASAVSEGTVKKIDKTAGKVTLAHGPLANLGMPAMTMAFKADPPKALDGLKVGDKVRFVAEDRQGVLYATRLEAAK